jgi:hypothetical protein
MDSIEQVGASAGKRTADLYKFRKQEGTCGSERRALPDAVRAANLEAQQFSDSESEDERAVAIYWQSYADAFEAAVNI